MINSGFRGEEAEKWRREHRADHRQLFEGCEAVANATRAFLGRNPVPNNDLSHIVPLLLLIRGLELFEAAASIGERGFFASTRIQVRALLEVLFTAGAVCPDRKALELWWSASRERLKWLNKLTNSVSFRGNALVQGLNEELRHKLEAEVEALGNAGMNVEELSRKTDLHELYLTVYVQYSRDVHTSSASLWDHVSGDEKGVQVIHAGPASHDIPYALSIAGLTLLDLLKTVAKARNVDLGSEGTALSADFRDFVRKY